MNLPPDIQIPEDFQLVGRYVRYRRGVERLWLEAGCLFKRSKRPAKLAEFESRWRERTFASIALRLVIREFREAYGPDVMISAATGRFMPSEMPSRAALYQLHAKFQTDVDQYRVKLGLPPIYSSAPIENGPS